MICHGQGDQRGDAFDGGCCFVNGQVCPNRWFVDYSAVPGGQSGDVTQARVLDSSRTDIGSVDTVARSFVGNNPNRRQRVYDAVQGALFICSSAVRAIDADPSILANRAAFDVAWAARIMVDAPSLPAGWGAWCTTFGPGEQQCCFAEDQATNTARSSPLSATAVTVRRSAQGAS